MNAEQAELIRSLRDLADYLETKEFDLGHTTIGTVDVYLFCDDGQAFLKNVKVMGGFQREFNDYSAQAVKKFGMAKFIVHSSREQVCERVKVGVEVRPAEPERVIPAQPERVVDKYEYKCPESLLAGQEN